MSSFNHRFIFYTPDLLMQIIINFAYVCALFSVEALFIFICSTVWPLSLSDISPQGPPPISPGFSIAGIFSRHEMCFTSFSWSWLELLGVLTWDRCNVPVKIMYFVRMMVFYVTNLESISILFKYLRVFRPHLQQLQDRGWWIYQLWIIYASDTNCPCRSCSMCPKPRLILLINQPLHVLSQSMMH